MSMRMYGSALALAATVMLAAGCDRGDSVADPATTTADARTDDQLATYVQARYQSAPKVAASEIDVIARDGVVTLRGTVPSDAAREEAATLARQTEGVRDVDNQLLVQAPTNPGGIIADARPIDNRTNTAAGETENGGSGTEGTSAWITTKILSQYFIDTDVKAWNIDVTTRPDGSVTLRGEVDDAESRDEAERIARETEGVTSVDNQVRVRRARRASSTATAENTTERNAGEQRADATTDSAQPDPWVTAKVQAKFFADDEVKGLDIDVDTQNGVVTLSGEVDNAAERRQAVALAGNTEGVRAVTDHLTVAPIAAERTSADYTARNALVNTAENRSQPVDDAWITTRIQSKFFLDRDIKGRSVNVDTQNGVVTLKGTVDTEGEKQTAAAIAEETEGVTRVVNQLAVTPPNPR